MADYGLEVFDEGETLFFNNTHNLFKIIGETNVRGKGTFQIPLRPHERPLVFPVWKKINQAMRTFPKLSLDENSGVLTYDTDLPITIVYGVW